MISRDRAMTARDHAINAHTTFLRHKRECRVCGTEPIPCTVGSMLERGTARFIREAQNALEGYLPVGTVVEYHGSDRRYRGRAFRVIGLSLRYPWAGYRLADTGREPFEASLESLRLTSREARERDLAETAKHAVADVSGVLARYGVTLTVSVERSVTGGVLVGWSPVEIIDAERAALHHADKQARQYISAALVLVQVARSACRDRSVEQLAGVADRARKLAKHVGFVRAA